MCGVLVVGSNARPQGAVPGTSRDPHEGPMATPPTIVHARMPNREPIGQGAHDLLLVFGVAAFVLGVAMVSRGVLPSQPAAHLLPTSPVALDWDARPVATTPPAHLVPPTPVTAPASSGGTRVAAVCPPRLALNCDLRLVLMQMARQQRGHSLARPVAPSDYVVPRKYGVLARAEASPPATPRRNDPGC